MRCVCIQTLRVKIRFLQSPLDRAPWRDYPKLLLELDVDDSLLVVSDTSWKVSSGPIIFDGLRNGEIYDARLEFNPGLSI
jgi:Alpha-L-rhamnosidase N-terminal domain